MEVWGGIEFFIYFMKFNFIIVIYRFLYFIKYLYMNICIFCILNFILFLFVYNFYDVGIYNIVYFRIDFFVIMLVILVDGKRCFLGRKK